jgi:hypothetical protein
VLRRALIGIVLSSAVLNVLLLAGSIYMMLVYDFVLPGRSLPTLFGLLMMVIAAYVFQGMLDALRGHVLVHLASNVDAALELKALDLAVSLARLNPARLGAGMLLFVEVLLDRTTPNVFDEFRAAVQVRSEILECHMVAGGFDYLIKIRASGMEAYREFAGNVLWQLPGVRETRTYAVMEEVKNSTKIHLP